MVDTLRARWPWSYEEGGHPVEMPRDVRALFSRTVATGFWRITLREGLQAHCHFFGPEEIEFDLDPRDVMDQASLDSVCEFARTVAEAADKPAVVCLESLPDAVIMRYDPARKDFVGHS